MASSDFGLHEQVLLLALHDEKGTTHRTMFQYALAGAAHAHVWALSEAALALPEPRR